MKYNPPDSLGKLAISTSFFLVLTEHSHGLTLWKVKPKFFNFVVCNPCQSSPSLTILVPLWFITISLVFFHLYKVLFSGSLQFKSNFVDGRNISKNCDGAPLTIEHQITMKFFTFQHYLLLQIATWSTSPHHTSYFLETRLAICLSWVFTSQSASRHQLFLSQLWNGWSLFFSLDVFSRNLNNITTKRHRRDSKSVKVFLENMDNMFTSNSLGV